MALFLVNRYQCEDEEHEGDHHPKVGSSNLSKLTDSIKSLDRSRSLLKKLHKRAAKVRTPDDDVEGDKDETDSTPSKSKRSHSTAFKSEKNKPKKNLKADPEPVKKKNRPKSGTDDNDLLSPKQTENADETDQLPNDDEDMIELGDQVQAKETEDESKTKDPGITILPDVEKKAPKKVQYTLPDWLAAPSLFSADIHGHKMPVGEMDCVDTDLAKKLQEKDITTFFPVQSMVIPAILNGVEGCSSGCLSGYRPSDLCCSAPTGSGKTLSYVIPIVQALKKRVVCRVRAVAVLPVRDLATQVYKVFTTFCEDTPLKVALLSGQKSFTDEQQLLVQKVPGRKDYCNLVDIIVATPGRLVDHLNETLSFDVSQLRFLVIDEADRMMQEIKHDWLSLLEQAVYQSRKSSSVFTSSSPNRPLTAAKARSLQVPMQKLLFSATLSQNPERLQLLNLFQPKLFTSATKNVTTTDAHNNAVAKKGNFVGKYTTPSGLAEYFIPCSQEEKPLHILHLLHNLKMKNVLCFTNSVEATERLYWLVKLFGSIRVEQFSSKLHAQKRHRLLRHFAAGEIDLVICSDAMARGMDVDGVRYVISYEMPPFVKTYVHRVGRTARAGRSGTAITLVEKNKVSRFKKMLKEAGKEDISELVVKTSSLKPLIEPTQEALKQVAQKLKT